MTLIIFLRHGQAQNNVQRILTGRTPGVSLTDAGKIQAQQAADLLGQFDISAIYSSPIERAQRTADIVAKHNSLDYTTDERLVELEMGDFTGMKYDDVFSKHDNMLMKFYENNPEIANRGVETFAQVKLRVREIIKDVSKKHHDQNVVLVTHMDPIKAMLSMVIETSPKTLCDLVLSNASLNIFREYEGEFFLSAINLMHPSRYRDI